MGNLINSFRNNTSATVNTNTSNNTMANIKSVEIAVNLILSANGASAGFFDKVQGESNGKTLVRGRSLSAVRVKGEDESIFGVFVPLPEQRVCKHGRNNTAVVIFHMEDGSTKILDAAQTEEFWADVLDLEEGLSATDIDFSVICDIPGYGADEANEMLRNNEARSIRIKFDGMPQFGTAVNNTHHRFSLRPVNATVNFSSATIGDDPNVVVFNNTRNVLTAKPRSTAKFDAAKFVKQSTSSKRREGRKAQAEAARQSVERVVYFDGAPVETPAVKVETPVVEAPVVDVEKEALRKENAELKAQVAELSANVANLTAMMQQFMASQAQPVAPTPVVEEVTPEPVSELEPEVIEEELAVEETVEEARKASQPSAADFLAARKAAAEAEKARKASNNNDDVDADFYMVDFD